MNDGVTNGQAISAIKRPSRGLISARQFTQLLDGLGNSFVSQQGEIPSQFPPRPISVKISGNQQAEDDDEGNTVYRWTYSGEQVEKTAGGYQKWASVTGGIMFDASKPETSLYNLAEDLNGSGGVTGSGINTGSLPTDQNAAPEDPPAFELQPIPNGRVVQAWPKSLPNGKIEFWCDFNNGIDGSCPAPPADGGTP